MPGVIVNRRPRGQQAASAFLGCLAVTFVFASAARPAGAAEALHAPLEQKAAWDAAKFGLFFHFGPWSQTGNGSIWTIAKAKDPQEQQRYLDLYRTFNPTRFDADNWAKGARESGAKYVVFTTKHHDGFCNFDSALTDFKSTSPDCPYSKSAHPDLTAEFVRAMRAQKLVVGLYYSHIDWHHPNGNWDRNTVVDEAFIRNHPTEWRNFAAYERGQVLELLTRYDAIDSLWFDVFWPHDGAEDARQMMQMVRSIQPNLLINDRGTAEYADYETPEQGIPNPLPAGAWESCITISEGDGFWYKGSGAKYKSTETLVRLLVDIVSKGGHLLLNVGPRGDGSWPPEESERLAAIGKWLTRNGAAIYGSSPSTLKSVPDWGRFTQNGSRIYAIVFDPTRSSIALPKDLNVHTAHLLDGGAALEVTQPSTAIGDAEVHFAARTDTTLPIVIVFDTAGRS